LNYLVCTYILYGLPKINNIIELIYDSHLVGAKYSFEIFFATKSIFPRFTSVNYPLLGLHANILLTNIVTCTLSFLLWEKKKPRILDVN